MEKKGAGFLYFPIISNYPSNYLDLAGISGYISRPLNFISGFGEDANFCANTSPSISVAAFATGNMVQVNC
jgi:hypothetical protein